jgi:hypothetical protein
VIKVLELSMHGCVLQISGDIMPFAFADFPWFRGLSAVEIEDARLSSSGHLYWPELDVDLSLACLRNPADFPLIAR